MVILEKSKVVKLISIIVAPISIINIKENKLENGNNW